MNMQSASSIWSNVLSNDNIIEIVRNVHPVRLTCTDHRIIEILGLRPSNRLPVSYCEFNSNTNLCSCLC